MNDQRVKVLYVAGSGRSGTTVISHILDQLDRVFAGGELRFLWQRGVVEDHLCGCGRPFSDCPFWTAVMAEVYGKRPESDVLDADAIGRRLLSRLRVLRVPAMLMRRSLGRSPVPGHADDQTIRRLYDAILKVTRAKVIVDSSKLPPYGLLLSQQPNIDLYVLHVVRDSRATAFSWLRKKESLDYGDDGELMPQMQTWKSSLLWLWWNFVTFIAWRRGRYLRVRYEDFVADPKAAMTSIADLIDVDCADLPFASPTSVRLAPAHFVAGNPNRHTTGAIEIRPDNEWRDVMPAKHFSTVTALTSPGLLSFGYSLGRRR
ncbi:MAG: sulfotransferase [Nocardioidaceae bacterium]